MSEGVDADESVGLIAMSDDAIAVHRHSECECGGKPVEPTEAEPKESTEPAEPAEHTKDTHGDNPRNDESQDYRGYICGALAVAGLTVGCLVCHHIALPVAVVKVGAAGLSKIAASKAAVHHFFARMAGQCCCCSCNGCNGCCPCGSACCSCAC